MKKHLSRNIPCVLALTLLLSSGALPQQYLSRAQITHSGEDVIVTAISPRPLEQAIDAISEEYGWIVDYEDPIYGRGESLDVTAPEWKKAHPLEKGQLLLPSGGKFVANLGKIATGQANQKDAIKLIVDQYNRSGNPGRFRVIQTTGGRLVVSGVSQTESDKSSGGVGDGVIQLSSDSEVASLDLQNVVGQCASVNHVAIIFGIVPANALSQSLVEGYKGSATCRTAIERILSSIPYALTYRLLYDIGNQSYYLSIMPAHQVVLGSDGKPKFVPPQKPTSDSPKLQ